MIYNAKESKLKLGNVQLDYITFGRGEKTLVMIQGLNTRGIKGAVVSLAYMNRIWYMQRMKRRGILIRGCLDSLGMKMERGDYSEN